MSVYGRVHDTGVPAANSADQVDDDEWETDPDFVNDVSEKQQRYGSVLITPVKAEMLNEETPDLPSMVRKAQQQQDEVGLQEWTDYKQKSLYGGEKDE